MRGGELWTSTLVDQREEEENSRDEARLDERDVEEKEEERGGREQKRGVL